MNIFIANTAGFCFGVKRAIDLAFREAKEGAGRVATLGPIIHNPQVIEQLKQIGVTTIDKLENPTSEIPLQGLDGLDTLIIRTHGIPLPLSEKLKSTGIKLIDATCPFVKKAQQYAKLLSEEGYKVLILGDKDHPEVQGILSYAGSEAEVVEPGKDLSPVTGRVGVVVQTTQPIEALRRLLNQIVETAKEIKVYNTICNSTAQRLLETEELARKVDIMYVIGGKNSANTKQLARLCDSIGVETYHIETAEEIVPVQLQGKENVGITAGASTPEWIIKEVYNAITTLSGEGPEVSDK